MDEKEESAKEEHTGEANLGSFSETKSEPNPDSADFNQVSAKRRAAKYIILLALAIIFIFLILFLRYYFISERNLETGAGLEEVFIQSEKTAYLNVNTSETVNMTTMTLVFYTKEGNETTYETNEYPGKVAAFLKGNFFQWLFGKKIMKEFQYSLSSDKVNLTDYKNIVKAEAFFEYKKYEVQQNATPPVLNQTNQTTKNTNTSGGGGGGGGGGGTYNPCVPNCVGKICGNDGCGGSCGTCNRGYSCNSTSGCGFVCKDDAGCFSSGLFCDNDHPYNCTLGALGCYNRTNLTQCSLGEQCVLGICQIVPGCSKDSDCVSLNLPQISTCINVPDGNPLTLDFAPANLSTCNLGSGKCAKTSYTYTHSCNIGCGAGCVADSNCSPHDCDYLDRCVGTTYYDYMDVKSNCTSCICSGTCNDFIGYKEDSRCVSQFCGDNSKSSSEVCDGTDLGSENCISKGYDSGTLGCCSNCQNFNLSGCEDRTYNSCSDSDGGRNYSTYGQTTTFYTPSYGASCPGDGQRPSSSKSEVIYDSCSGSVLTEAYCVSSTSSSTSTYDCSSEGKSCSGGKCVTPPPTCGNGVINSGEVCDGTDLGGQTCISKGYSGGSLSCLSNCLGFDFSSCTNYTIPTCGNGVINSGEVCDGQNLGGKTCVSQGYTGGDLSCLPSCLGFNFSLCTNDKIVSDCMLIMSSGDYIVTGNINQELDTTCIEIHAANVKLDCNGYSITTSSAAHIAGIASLASNSKITNCDISGFTKGMAIYLRDSDNTEISSNTFNSNSIGVLVDTSDHIVISSNNLGDNTDGGIWLNPGGLDATVEGNSFSGGTFYGVMVDDNSVSTKIQDNDFNGCDEAVHIEPGSTSTDVLYNQITSVSSWGIVSHSGNTRAIGNTISGSKWAIQASGNSNLIYENTISGSKNAAITMMSGDYSIVEKNVLDSDNSGIQLSGTGANVVIKNNTIKNGVPVVSGYITIAISSHGSTGTTIQDNTIDNYDRGIHIENDNTGIKLYGNKVSNCDFGMMYGTTNNGITIENNVFCGNTVDTRCFLTASIDSNKCNVNNGCSGTCDACSLPSLSIWQRIKELVGFVG